LRRDGRIIAKLRAGFERRPSEQDRERVQLLEQKNREHAQLMEEKDESVLVPPNANEIVRQ